MISVSPNTCSRFGAKRPVYPASASPGPATSASGSWRSRPTSPVSASSWSGSLRRAAAARLTHLLELTAKPLLRAIERAPVIFALAAGNQHFPTRDVQPKLHRAKRPVGIEHDGRLDRPTGEGAQTLDHG